MKLVLKIGIGMIVVGVVKGNVDVILVSGYEGGIGVVVRISICYVGVLWEIGLVEIY